MDPSIQKFFLGMPDQKQEMAIQVREIILSEDPQITEKIKWKQLTFSIGKFNMAFIYTFPGTDYINLGFFEATSLSDPQKLFEGTGKRMRHLKIYSDKDIPEEQIRIWVNESVLLKS